MRRRSEREKDRKICPDFLFVFFVFLFANRVRCIPPWPRLGGGWQSESTFSFNMGTEFRDWPLSQRCAIGKRGVCVLSRSSTAHVLAHVSLENPLRLSKAGARALGFAGLVPVSVVPM